MFRAHRPIFRRVRTAVHTTNGSVSVPLCSRAVCVVACLGDYSLLASVYCWISTCFGRIGPSSGEFVQLFTQPMVQFLCRSVRVLCVLWPVLVTILYWLPYIAGSLHVSGPQAHLQESSYSCSHNHWFSFCAALFACSAHRACEQSGTDTEPLVV